MNWWTQLSANIEPKFTILGIKFHYYGLLMGLAIIIALWLAQKRSTKYGLTRSQVESLVWWSLLPGLIGARIYHVIDNLTYYILHPFDIVAVWQGGLAIYGGLIGGLIGIIYSSKIQKIQLWKFLDLITPSVAIAQAIGRWGNFFNMEGYGPPTNLPWKIFISPAKRITPYIDYEFFHPLFLYESIFSFITFIILITISRKQPKTGTITGLYLILYGVSRFIIEFGRMDTAVFSGIKIAQIISLLFIITGLFIIFRTKILKHLPKPPFSKLK